MSKVQCLSVPLGSSKNSNSQTSELRRIRRIDPYGHGQKMKNYHIKMSFSKIFTFFWLFFRLKILTMRQANVWSVYETATKISSMLENGLQPPRLHLSRTKVRSLRFETYRNWYSERGGSCAVEGLAAVGDLRILHVISVTGWNLLRPNQKLFENSEQNVQALQGRVPLS